MLTTGNSIWTKYTVAGTRPRKFDTFKINALPQQSLDPLSSQCSFYRYMPLLLPPSDFLPNTRALYPVFGEVVYSTLCSFWSHSSVWFATLHGNSKASLLSLFEHSVDLFTSYRRTYMPSSYHIVQELQKYNIPDYRPRQEQSVSFLVLVARYLRKLPYLGFKRPSRKFGQPNGCDETEVSPLVKLRIRVNKIRRSSYARTTHQRLVHDLLDIRLQAAVSQAGQCIYSTCKLSYFRNHL